MIRHSNAPKLQPNRVPFPELPLPSKYQKIRIAKPVVDKPAPKQEPTKPLKPLAVQPLPMVVPELIIGGEVTLEPIKHDEGSYTVEELDLLDYRQCSSKKY